MRSLSRSAPLTDVEIARVDRIDLGHRLLDASQQGRCCAARVATHSMRRSTSRAVEASGASRCGRPRDRFTESSRRGSTASRRRRSHCSMMQRFSGRCSGRTGSPRSATSCLGARRCFTRSSARSSCGGRGGRRSQACGQYAFLHALVRDVSYGQLRRGGAGRSPSRERLRGSSRSAGRDEDRAEMLAHHYVACSRPLACGRASTRALWRTRGCGVDRGRVEGEALGSTSPPAAHYRAALTLTGPADERDPDLLLRLARRQRRPRARRRVCRGGDRHFGDAGLVERAAEAAAVVVIAGSGPGARTPRV